MISVILAILSISTMANAAGASSYSISGRVVQNQIIELDSTYQRSYTHYLANEIDAKDYTFSIQMSEELPGIFISLSEYSLLDPLTNSAPENPTKICDVYQVKLTYPNGVSGLLCNGTQTQFSYLDTDSGIISDYSGIPGLIVVDVFIISGYRNQYAGDSFRKLSDSPLVGPTGREIPISSIGSIIFTAYKDCSNSTFVETAEIVLKSCSAYSKSKCIATDLFCDGDSNCGLSFLDVFATGELDPESYDESDKRCSNNRQWAQKAKKSSNYVYNSNSEYTYTTYSSSGSGYRHGFIIIPVGLIAVLIGIVIRLCSRRRTNAITTVVPSQQGLLREP